MQQSPKQKKGDVFWPIYICEKRTTFAKACGIKISAIGNVLGNIVRTWGTNGEIDENTLGTKENDKKPPLPITTRKVKNWGTLSTCKYFH
jgi:hypothetical protein